VVHHFPRQPRIHRNYLHLHLHHHLIPSYLLICHPERGRFLADEGPAVSLCIVFAVSRSSAFVSFYDVGRKGEVCPAKSSHVGFVFSISAIFLARLQPLISFSRRIAALMSVKTS
jgi:hypothetical protein